MRKVAFPRNGALLEAMGPRLISAAEGKDHRSLHQLLAREPVKNLFLLGVLEDLRAGRLREAVDFYVLPSEDEPLAATLVSPRGLWVPYAPDPELAHQLGTQLRHLPLVSALGERAAIDALWDGYNQGEAGSPRMDRVQRPAGDHPGRDGPLGGGACAPGGRGRARAGVGGQRPDAAFGPGAGSARGGRPRPPATLPGAHPRREDLRALRG